MQSEWVIAAGIALVFIGFLLLIAGSLLGSGDGEVRSGGVILIGPIPIIFGNDRRLIVVAAGAALLILVASLLFLRRVPA